MIPLRPDARRAFADADLEALLRQPRAPYRPLPTIPLHDLGRPPEPGALAWLLAHGLPGEHLRQDMAVWIDAAEGRVDDDPGLLQAWAHARQHAGGLQPGEKVLTTLTTGLGVGFLNFLGVRRLPADAAPEDMNRVLRQGCAVAYMLDLPLGRQVPPHIRNAPREPRRWSPETLFGRDAAVLRENVRTQGASLVRMARKVGEPGDRPPGLDAGVALFETYVGECADRIGRLGRAGPARPAGPGRSAIEAGV